MGLLEEQCAESKKALLPYCCNQVWIKNWWADSMECYTYLRNVQDLLPDGKTPYERRVGNHLKDRSFRLVHWFEYYPISAKYQSRIHQFGKKVLPGLFLGYALYAERIWKGDILVADIEELETMDAPEIYSKRPNAKEVIFLKENGKCIFQSQMDESKHLEEIRNWEHPPWYGRDQFKERVTLTFLENQKGLFHNLKTHFRMPVKRSMIFWSMSGSFIYRHHVELRVKLYSPREESLTIPLKIHWRNQNYSYEFGC